MQKKMEKETKENIQKMKKEEREAKKKKKNEELSLKKKQSAPKKRSRKQVEDEETSTDDDISLHDSDGIDTLDDFIKYTESQKSDSDCEGESNRNLNFTKIKTNQTYVIVEYEMEYFPGIVKGIKNGKFEVSTLTMCGTQGLQWKWPDPEDKIWYNEKDVKEIIEPPKLISATSPRSSGVYNVPEIEKYRKPCLF